MQEVAEFVEDCFHFTMREQRRLIVDGRREIAADKAQLGQERIHPGASTLILAWEPVGVEGAGVFDGIRFDGGIPDWHALLFLHYDAENATENFEHSVDY